LQSTWEGAKILQHHAEKGDDHLKALKDKFYELWERSKENDLKSQ
jgi:hypothetical protein